MSSFAASAQNSNQHVPYYSYPVTEKQRQEADQLWASTLRHTWAYGAASRMSPHNRRFFNAGVAQMDKRLVNKYGVHGEHFVDGSEELYRFIEKYGVYRVFTLTIPSDDDEETQPGQEPTQENYGVVSPAGSEDEEPIQQDQTAANQDTVAAVHQGNVPEDAIVIKIEDIDDEDMQDVALNALDDDTTSSTRNQDLVELQHRQEDLEDTVNGLTTEVSGLRDEVGNMNQSLQQILGLLQNNNS